MNKTENKLTLLATPLGINNLNYSREVARSEVARLTDKKCYKNSSSSLKIKLSENPDKVGFELMITRTLVSGK